MNTLARSLTNITPIKNIALHLTVWSFNFLICLKGHAYLFGTNITATPTLIYASVIFLLVIANHLVVVMYGSYLTKQSKWLLLATIVLTAYIISVLVIVMPFKYLAAAFPDVGRIVEFKQIVAIRSVADVWSFTSFIWVSSSVLIPNSIAAIFFFSKRNYEANKRNALLQKEKTEMELNFLRAQIHPHFLFNTLNNIYGMVMENEKAGQVVLKLSDLLRFSLYESSGKQIPISREAEFLTDYINLEQIRHHNTRIAISYNFEHIKNNATPIVPLLLISFVENAFKHGLNATIGKAWVHISLKQDNHTILFEVENSKPAKKKERSTTAGIGIENTKRRLALLYPEKHHLSISETTDSYKVSLTLHTHA